MFLTDDFVFSGNCASGKFLGDLQVSIGLERDLMVAIPRRDSQVVLGSG